MLQLTLPNDTNYSVLEDRVKMLLIPSEVKTDNSLSEPILRDEGKTITGKDLINVYLDELEKFSKQWYACRCDMFP